MFRVNFGSGRFAPARFLLLAAMCALPLTVQAQVPQRPAPSTVPVPGDLELNKLVWSTMAAVDHANQAGNYSVLRDLAAPGFQINNDSARLATIFQSLRASGIDLSNTLLLTPNYTATPKIVSAGVMQLQGFFGLRPTAITFDLYYQWVGGKWKLFGVSIVPANLATTQPVPQPNPSRQPSKRN